MTRLFAERLWGVPWSVLAVLALVIAAIYVVVDTSGGAVGLRWWVLRWLHSLCWLLLALAALAMARITPLPPHWANGLALAGGVAYAIFIATSVLGRS
ncbi:hypothetical protein [Devosia sp. FKR38]|uniref:hypothetical protein n=1 Tax=Devosia sp. FKR38 TaxID=2562312 RepID=UPI0010BFABFB|nr:hypothetical protein [Devosia sp. FKR38]